MLHLENFGGLEIGEYGICCMLSLHTIAVIDIN